MKIHIYALCWNEEVILPYFLKHYAPIADSIFIYDNMSTDGSASIVKSFSNTEIRSFDTGEQFREDIQHDIRLNEWKKSRGIADWVVVADVDELLHHADLRAFLAECKEKGITIPAPTGFAMVSHQLPKTPGMIYEEIQKGVPDKRACKYSVFDPNAIEEMNYNVGNHVASPTGRVVIQEFQELKLLHYKYLSLDYLVERYALYASRQSDINRKNGWAWQYGLKSEALKRFNHANKEAVNVFNA